MHSMCTHVNSRSARTQVAIMFVSWSTCDSRVEGVALSRYCTNNTCTLNRMIMDPPVDQNVYSFKMAAVSIVRGDRAHTTSAKQHAEVEAKLDGEGYPTRGATQGPPGGDSSWTSLWKD